MVLFCIQQRVRSIASEAEYENASVLRLHHEKLRLILDQVQKRERILDRLSRVQCELWCEQLAYTAERGMKRVLMRCATVLKHLMLRTDAAGFCDPVDPLAYDPPLTDYFDIVPNPMDLGTVKVCLGAGVGFVWWTFCNVLS